MESISLLKMAIFSRHCLFSDGENHQGQCQKIARGKAIFRENNLNAKIHYGYRCQIRDAGFARFLDPGIYVVKCNLF